MAEGKKGGVAVGTGVLVGKGMVGTGVGEGVTPGGKVGLGVEVGATPLMVRTNPPEGRVCLRTFWPPSPMASTRVLGPKSTVTVPAAAAVKVKVARMPWPLMAWFPGGTWRL